ncbi:MAG: urocanate hydratase, partial [Desulfobulbaceae bacterium]|nr:urocanate hydratase [Desulfobulbaceae bacterium]
MKIRLEDIFSDLPAEPPFDPDIRRAPARHFSLSQTDTVLALKNALRYVPKKWHTTLAPEFLSELMTRGRIYGYRFRPPGQIKGIPID